LTTALTTTIDSDNVRQWIQIKSTDVPVDADITYMITNAELMVQQETSTTTQGIFDLLVLFKASVRVLKALASRSVKNGYVNVSTGLGTIRKSPQELLNLAKDLNEEYNDFIEMTITDVAATKFLGELNNETQQDFKDIFAGTNNAWEFQMKLHNSVNRHWPYTT
jgi:hypothetical protein